MIEENYTMLNNLPRVIKMLFVSAPESRDPKYAKQAVIEQKGKANKFAVITGDFHTPFSVVNRISKQEIGENIEDPVDIYRALHRITAEDMFFQGHMEYRPSAGPEDVP